MFRLVSLSSTFDHQQSRKAKTKSNNNRGEDKDEEKEKEDKDGKDGKEEKDDQIFNSEAVKFDKKSSTRSHSLVLKTLTFNTVYNLYKGNGHTLTL